MNGKKQMSKSNEILFQKVQPNEVEVKYTKEGKNVIFNKKSQFLGVAGAEKQATVMIFAAMSVEKCIIFRAKTSHMNAY